MEEYNSLVLSLIDATMQSKITWTQSSVKGGYFTKLNEYGIEVIPPASTITAMMVESIAAANQNPSKLLPGEDPPYKYWRIITYDEDGSKEFEITQPSLDTNFFKGQLGDAYTAPIVFLFRVIEKQFEIKKSDKLNKIIDLIKDSENSKNAQ